MINKNTRLELLKATIRQNIREHEDRLRNIESCGDVGANITNTTKGMIIEARTILYLITDIENMPIEQVRKELRGMDKDSTD